MLEAFAIAQPIKKMFPISDLDSYALSVRVLESGVFKIKHYKIKRQGDKVFIAQRLKFESLLKLVEYYRGKASLPSLLILFLPTSSHYHAK